MINSLVVYFSKFGNTKIVAETITETLKSAGSVSLLSAPDLPGIDLKQYDVVLVGTPTHKMNLPKFVKLVFEKLPKRCLKGVPMAAFDTSYRMSPWLNRFTAAKHLSRKLRKLGGKEIIAPETFHVMESEGPLYEGEIERARDWAQLILERR